MHMYYLMDNVEYVKNKNKYMLHFRNIHCKKKRGIHAPTADFFLSIFCRLFSANLASFSARALLDWTVHCLSQYCKEFSLSFLKSSSSFSFLFNASVCNKRYSNYRNKILHVCHPKMYDEQQINTNRIRLLVSNK